MLITMGLDSLHLVSPWFLVHLPLCCQTAKCSSMDHTLFSVFPPHTTDVGQSSWELHISLSCLAVLAHFSCSHVFSGPVTRSTGLLVSRTYHPTMATQPWLWRDTSFCVEDPFTLSVWNILYSKCRKPTFLTFKIRFKNILRFSPCPKL